MAWEVGTIAPILTVAEERTPARRFALRPRKRGKDVSFGRVLRVDVLVHLNGRQGANAITVYGGLFVILIRARLPLPCVLKMFCWI